MEHSVYRAEILFSKYIVLVLLWCAFFKIIFVSVCEQIFDQNHVHIKKIIGKHSCDLVVALSRS